MGGEEKDRGIFGQPMLSLEVASILVLLLVQSGTAFWWASSINERMRGMESWRDQTFSTADRVSRVETRMETTKETLTRIEAKIDLLAGTRSQDDSGRSNYRKQ